MACPDFEELLIDGGNGHAAQCESCRALLDAMARVDTILDAALGSVCAPPGLAAAVRARVSAERPLRMPSLLPEVLDFIGWAAILATAAIVILRFLPLIQAVLAEAG